MDHHGKGKQAPNNMSSVFLFFTGSGAVVKVNNNKKSKTSFTQFSWIWAYGDYYFNPVIDNLASQCH